MAVSAVMSNILIKLWNSDNPRATIQAINPRQKVPHCFG